jgi:hypothetical protein
MKIRSLVITAASVIALSSTAMADDHLSNALDKGGLKADSPAVANDELGRGAGQGSPFSGEDTQIPASRTIEEVNLTIIKQCDPGNPGRCLP